jgi:hypothetical protein
MTCKFFVTSNNLVEIIASSVVLAGDNGAELTLTIPVLDAVAYLTESGWHEP